MDSPLIRSRITVDTQNSRNGDFNQRANDAISGVLDRVASTSQSQKSSKGDVVHEFIRQRDIELQSIYSNGTIAQGGDGGDANEKNFMFTLDEGLEFPEGGTEAYLVVFGAFMGLISCFGTLNVLGAIQTYVAENQLKGVKSSTVAWIFSLMSALTFTTSIFSGTYFDHNGPREILIVGMLLTVGGLMCTANSTKFWHFILSFSIMVGIGIGVAAPPIVGCVAHYFNRRRGLMTSLASTGGSVGGIIFPITLRKLFEQVGFKWAIRIQGFITLFCFAVCIHFVKHRLPTRKLEGGIISKSKVYLSAIDIRGLLVGNYFFVVVGCALAESAALTVSTYHASYARAQGASLSTSYLLISLSHAGGIPGRWLTGFLSDRIGRFNIMIFTLILSGFVIYITLLPFGSHTAALYVFSISWGFSTGSIFSLLPVCCGQISKTEDFGKRYGTMYFIVAFVTLVSIPIAGAIIGNESLIHYRNFVIYSGLLAIISGISYAVSRIFSVGGRLLVKF